MTLVTACTLATVLGQGHSSRNVAERYGEVAIKAQAVAIAKLPRYNVAQKIHEVAVRLTKSALHQ